MYCLIKPIQLVVAPKYHMQESRFKTDDVLTKKKIEHTPFSFILSVPFF